MAAPGYGLRGIVLAQKDETTEGTWIEPSTDYGTVLYAADFRLEAETFKNNPLSVSLTPRDTTIGGHALRLTWESELGGSGDSTNYATTDPQWAKTAAGMQSRQGKTWSVSADAGTPIPGEKCLDAGGTNGLYFFKILGTPGSATAVIGVEIGTLPTATSITGELSGATFTTSSGGTNYNRIHTPITAATARSYGLNFLKAGQSTTYLRIAGKGNRGTYGISARKGQTVRLNAECLGVFEQAECKEVTIATIAADAYTQLGFIGSSFFTAYGQAAADIVFESFDLAIGNPMAARSNANNAAGYLSVMHGPGGREPSGSFDPEPALDGSDDEIWAQQIGVQGIFAFDLGSSNGDILEVRVGRATITGYDGGDRGPVKVLALPFDAAGAGTATDFEIMIGTR